MSGTSTAAFLYCASVMIEKKTFGETKTKDGSYTLKYYKNSKAVRANKIGLKDNQGRMLYFNSIVYFQPTFEGAELKPVKPVKIKLPLVNADKEGYMLYEGSMQGGTVVWTNTGKPCTMQTAGNCQTYDFDWQNTGYCACAMPRACEEDCNEDAFMGEEAPALTDARVRYSGEKVIVRFQDGTYNDLSNVTVIDDNDMEEDLDVCEMFEYGITSDDWYPNRHKMTDKKNIIVRSEATPGKKTSRIYVPKAQVSGLSKPVLLVGERHSKGFPTYIDQVVEPTTCLGPVNCDYVVFDAPSTGLYKLGEWNADAPKPKMEDQYVLKVRLLKDSEVFVGNKKTGEVYKASNAERNGKTRVKEYRIAKSDAPSDVVVFVRNATKRNFKLWQEVKLSDLKYKKASNMYIMRRVKFNKVQDYSEIQVTACGENGSCSVEHDPFFMAQCGITLSVASQNLALLRQAVQYLIAHGDNFKMTTSANFSIGFGHTFGIEFTDNCTWSHDSGFAICSIRTVTSTSNLDRIRTKSLRC